MNDITLLALCNRKWNSSRICSLQSASPLELHKRSILLGSYHNLTSDILSFSSFDSLFGILEKSKYLNILMIWIIRFVGNLSIRVRISNCSNIATLSNVGAQSDLEIWSIPLSVQLKKVETHLKNVLEGISCLKLRKFEFEFEVILVNFSWTGSWSKLAWTTAAKAIYGTNKLWISRFGPDYGASVQLSNQVAISQIELRMRKVSLFAA